MIKDLVVSGIVQEHFSKTSSCASLIVDQLNSGLYARCEKYMRDKLVIDVGANIGLFTLYASQFAESVLSVEPTQSHQEVFNCLMEDNAITNVKLLKAALSTENKVLDFYESTSNSTMNSLFNYEPASTTSYQVQGMRLKDILESVEGDLGVIKIDIEGSEKFLLEDEQFFKSLQNTNSLFVEVHEVDGKTFEHIVTEWREKLEAVFKNITRIGVDGIWCTKEEL